MDVDVIHTAIWVSDLEETKAFYLDELGLERSRSFERDGVVNYFVRGSGETEIQFKHAEGEEPPDPAGIDHIALAVDDVDATFEYLTEEAGSDVVIEPSTSGGTRTAFLTDPDGYTLELIEEVE